MAPHKPAPAEHARPGRPRRSGVEEDVLSAVMALLVERGVEGTTTSAVVERSGVARATVYLRWPNRRSLITAAVRRAMRRRVIDASGDLERDLRASAEQVRAILSSPDFRGVFPAVVADLTTGGPDRLSFDAIAPGRATIAREYDRLAAAQGFRDDVSGDIATDLVLGAAINHYLVTGEPPSAAERDAAMRVVIDGLRRRPATDTAGPGN
jgi:AcrR family transcriptional regulator